jgi:hypothetical protein
MIARRHEASPGKAASFDIVAPPAWSPAVLATVGFIYVTSVLCGRHDLHPARGSVLALPVVVTLATALMALWRMPILRRNPARITWNACGVSFLLGYILGLHLQLFVHWTRIDFTLAPGGIKNPLPVLLVGALFAGAIVWHLHWAKRAKVLKPYLVLLLLPNFTIAATTFVLRNSHYLHYHHYLIGATQLPLACFRHPVSRCAQGLMLALLVEGAARWGFDPVWVPR